MTCNVCGDRDLACPKCQPENWASRWRAQRLRAYWEAVDALKLELDRQRGLAKSDKGNSPEVAETGCEEAGFTPTMAERMAADFHHQLLRKAFGDPSDGSDRG